MRRRLTRIAQALLIVALVPFLVDVPRGEDAAAGELLATGAAPNARLVIVGGRSTVVAEAGRSTDPALVLVHGFGGSTFGWRAVMAPLAARGWHVVALDLPGFGLSEKSWSFDYDHETQARYVLATMDQLGVERAVIVGHSMGGNVAAWIAALAPERVAGLALVDGGMAVRVMVRGRVVLRAADPEYVLTWRVEAEERMKASGKPGLSRADIEDYIRRFLPAYRTWGGAPEFVSPASFRNLLLEAVLAKPTLSVSPTNTWRTIPFLDRERVMNLAR